MRLKLDKYTFLLVAPAIGGFIVSWYIGQTLKEDVLAKIRKETEMPMKNVRAIDLKGLSRIDKLANSLSNLPVVPYAPQQAQGETEEPPPNYKLSFVYIGKNKKFAVIDGKLYMEGDLLPSEEKILKIRKDSILLTGKWGERWVKVLD